MPVIVDSSVVLAVVLAEPERHRIIDATRGLELCSPEILPYEVGNALSAMVRRQRLATTAALAAWRSFSMIPVRLLACDISAALQLAVARKIYAYDAYFLQTANKSGQTLFTLDRAMQRIAADLGIETIEVDP